MTETSAERILWKCLKTVDWQLQSPLISHCFFLSLLFSVHKLGENHSGTILGEKCSRKERFKWKTLCQINGSHWASLFTQSLSHPVSQSVKWTCRLFNTYRNEENIHVLKQQPRTHTRWGNLLIYQIFIRCKCGGGKWCRRCPWTPVSLPAYWALVYHLSLYILPPFLSTSRPVTLPHVSLLKDSTACWLAV